MQYRAFGMLPPRVQQEEGGGTGANFPFGGRVVTVVDLLWTHPGGRRGMRESTRQIQRKHATDDEPISLIWLNPTSMRGQAEYDRAHVSAQTLLSSTASLAAN